MPAVLKDLYFSSEFVHQLAEVMGQVYAPFDRARFLELALDDDWPGRELKDRMRHLSHCLHATLPADYWPWFGKKPGKLGWCKSICLEFYNDKHSYGRQSPGPSKPQNAKKKASRQSPSDNNFQNPDRQSR